MAAPAPQPFVMHGARDAMSAGLAHIEEQVKGIEQAVVENPGLAFDLAKTLVESTCRAVLGERSVAYTATDDLPKLFKFATQNLPFLPPTASDAAEVRKSLAQTLAGLSTAIQGICELRNQCGFASHGAGEPRPVMEAVQALLAAEAATPSSASFTASTGRIARRQPQRVPVLRTERPSMHHSMRKSARSRSAKLSSARARCCSEWSRRRTASTSPNSMATTPTPRLRLMRRPSP